MEICLATETSAAEPIDSSPCCLCGGSGEPSFFMLDLRAGNARCRESCVAPFVSAEGSDSTVGCEYPLYLAER